MILKFLKLIKMKENRNNLVIDNLNELSQDELILTDGGGLAYEIGYWTGRAAKAYADYAAVYGQHNMYGT